jgi:UPF0755 protein
MNKNLKILLGAAGFLILATAAFSTYLALSYTQSPASSQSHEVIFEVTPSMSFDSVSKDLQKAGVIKSSKLFYIYARVKGARGKLRVGEYSLNTNMVPGEVLAIITSGKSITRPFLVPEGYNVFEVADLYEKEGFGHKEEFLALAFDKAFVKSLLGEEHDSFEGYLFPETYQITKFMTAKDVITAMVHRFQIVFGEVTRMFPGSELKGHKAVTLASIIEKETGNPEERRRISSVFYNRLKKGMKLQTDPTIIYGIAAQTGKVPNNIHREDILKPTKYNTYVITGLPPGPIANPGREALMAAMNPEATEFLYFVSQNNGTHVFTSKYEDHAAAVKKFQLDAKARAGKSWRDLNKKPVSSAAPVPSPAPQRH